MNLESSMVEVSTEHIINYSGTYIVIYVILDGTMGLTPSI